MSGAPEPRLHILVAGPMTLELLEPHLGGAVPSAGFPFPGTAQLVLGYLARGHRVTAVTTGTDIAAPLHARGRDLDVVVLPARGRGRARAFDLFRAERRLIRQAIAAASPDVVHAHWTYEFGLAARQSPAPSVVTVHDWAPAVARFNRHPYWYFRWVMQVLCLVRPGLLTAPSEYVASRVRRTYRRRCEVVHNGVDLRPYAAEPGPASADGPVVAMLNVGFSNRKNVQTALLAWPLVRARHPEARLLLAGPEYEPGGLADAWAAERGLRAGVELLGPLRPGDVPALLRGADVFLHTSLEESFGVVLVEAMAAGAPVVAGADSGAPTDVLGDAGVLVDVADPRAVADAVADLLDDPARAELLRRRGTARAEGYDLDRVLDHYLRLLGETAAATRRPTAPAAR